MHRVIFEGMEHLHRENKEIDVITLTEELRRMKRLDDVGGVEYVLQLPNLVATAANIEYHANIVSEKALARKLISTCTELTTEAYDGEKEPEDLLDDAERKILQLSDTKNRGDFAPSAPSSKRPSIKLLSSMKIKPALQAFLRAFATWTA